MLRIALPILLAVIGVAGGAAAGFFLRPTSPDTAAEGEAAPDVAESPEEPAEYVRMTNQFIVPVLKDGQVVSIVVLSLGLEVEPGSENTVYSHEPKLRDVLLQVLFSHANNGGFEGEFTDAANMMVVRTALREAAESVLPELVRDVLINDITRQDG
jgi:flagellar FliL protein